MKQKTNPLKKHKISCSIFVCIISVIMIVTLLLFVVWFFEVLKLNVPGSRDMWIGLIGSLLGGAFTLFGVLITLYKQEDRENTKNRLANMPILGFTPVANHIPGQTIISCYQGKLTTSCFAALEDKNFITINVATLNTFAAFNFTYEGCAINGQEIPKSTTFNPSKERIITSGGTSFNFDIDKCNTNLFCLLRVSYDDIFKNKYYQDIPFIYLETNSLSNRKKNQNITLRDIKQPVLEDTITPLEEAVKEYIDSPTFCKSQHHMSI